MVGYGKIQDPRSQASEVNVKISCPILIGNFTFGTGVTSAYFIGQ